MSLRSARPHIRTWQWPFLTGGLAGYPGVLRRYHGQLTAGKAEFPSPRLNDVDYASLPSFFRPSPSTAPPPAKRPAPLLPPLPPSPQPTSEPRKDPTLAKIVPFPQTPDKDLYGKWRFLLEDNDRVRAEIAGTSTNLLIDNPEWRDDVALWACLLDVSLRWNRRKGAQHMLKLFLDRQPDIALDGPLAEFFWDTVTAVALDRLDSFECVCLSALAVATSRNVLWPRLYTTGISSLLDNGRYAEALEWHIKLMPVFDPGSDPFSQMLRRFAINTHPECQAVLKEMYSQSPYRDIYDKVIPALHHYGRHAEARSWRLVLLDHFDRPRHPISGPFVRFLRRYFPETGLCEEELMVSHPSFKSWSAQQHLKDAPVTTKTDGGEGSALREPPNDGLVARWFASEWSSIDFSLTVIHRLGVKTIGSLALQSLGLRCSSAEDLEIRLRDVRAMGIKVTQSNYSKVVASIAHSRNDEQLFDLLKSDVHPDVFEDISLLRSILDAASKAGDWKKHRLFATIQGILDEETTPKLYRDALTRRFRQPRRWESALRLLHDATANGVSFRLSIFDAFFDALRRDARKRCCTGIRTHCSPAVSICFSALQRGYAVPAPVWSTLLSILARDNRLVEVQSISDDLIAHYTALRTSGSAIRMHTTDAVFRSKLRLLHGGSRTSIPARTPFRNKYHPLRLIFNDKVIMDILAAGFRAPLGRPAVFLADAMAALSSAPVPPAAFGPASGVRLLRMISDSGVPISKSFVASAITYAAIDWRAKPWRMRYSALLTTNWRAYSLHDVKMACDRAWGAEIVPDLATFEEQVNEARKHVVQDKRARDEVYRTTMRKVYQGGAVGVPDGGANNQ